MCIIVDANLASLVFAPQPNGDFAPVMHWLLDPRKDGCLVYGGHLAKELEELGNARRILRSLLEAGRAFRKQDDLVEAETQKLLKSDLCASDDPHVIAMARVSGARTLCSHDHALHRDFTDPRLISKPRGHVYQTADHTKLLCHTASCGRKRKRRQ